MQNPSFSAGLFGKAIMMSGNLATPSYKFNSHPLDTGQAFAQEMGVRTSDKEDLEETVKKLQSKS